MNPSSRVQTVDLMANRMPGFARRRRKGGDGDVEVFCVDEQSDVAVDLERWRALVLATLREEGVSGQAELTVVFVDEAHIADLNAQYMNKQGPTDVLAFPIDAVEAEPNNGPGAISRGPDRPDTEFSDLPLLLGDVIVCPEVAQHQFSDHAGTFEDEMALLLVHGVLHVMGHDHMEPDQREEMQRREREILAKHHWRGDVPQGFRQDHPEDAE